MPENVSKLTRWLARSRTNERTNELTGSITIASYLDAGAIGEQPQLTVEATEHVVALVRCTLRSTVRQVVRSRLFYQRSQS